MGVTCIRILLLLFAVFGASFGHDHVQFTLVVPKVLYYDSPTVASVSAYGVESGSEASVTLEYRGRYGGTLNTTQLGFTSDGSQNWTVTFSFEHHWREKIVDLVMTSKEQSKTSELTFAKNFGYIFVQTDKPVYSPGQTVKYRVIAVDEQQRQAAYKIRIDVKNPQQTVIDRRIATADETFKAQDLVLPKEASIGNWSITANFEGMDNIPRNVQTVTFEVKEFVLPRFNTEVSITPKIVTKQTDIINITAHASYFFNRGVSGTAGVQLGTWDNVNKLQFRKYFTISKVNQLPQEIKFVNGSFNHAVQVDQLQIAWERLPRNTRLYVKVNITDAVTGEVDTFEDSSTFLSYPDYAVEFKGSKSYFTPGFNYTLQIQVIDPSNRPASEINLSITSRYILPYPVRETNRTSFASLDRYGKTQLNITVPDKTESITFSVSIANGENVQPHTFTINKYKSESKEYIHISLAGPIREKAPGFVLLNYTKPTVTDKNVGNRHDQITVLVLAKGHIVFTTSVKKMSGKTYVELPVHLYTMTTPRMRIIAYYYVHGHQEYIMDSLVADTRHVCVEEISLKGQGLYKPNQNLTLEVDGGPGMRVGLVAVDKAVFALSRDKTQTLTRNMMFAKLGSHDSGTESGDGGNMEDILSNSGLQHLSLSIRPFRKAARGYSVFNSLSFKEFLAEPAMGRVQDSMHKTESSDTAASRVSSPSETEEKQEDPPQTVRRNFPESWLFEDYQLDSEGLLNLALPLPSSITAWSFLAVGVSSNRGICVSEPMNLIVTKLFFADVKLPSKVKRLEKVTMHIVLYNNNPYLIEVHVSVSGSEGLCFMDSLGANISEKNITLNPYDFHRKSLQFIPMRIGDLKVLVDLKTQHEVDWDAVEKSLHVVAEGGKVKKSITFVLDPEAKTGSVKSRGNKNSTTVKNVYDSQNKQQNTTINLSLPVEAIKGTGVCQISAFGDLMGDILSHSVKESKSLTDNTIMDAEEALGDLAPTVYALLYAKSSGLMDAKLRERSKEFIQTSVIRLLNYQKNDSFGLTTDSKPATWLTAFVLKTLCQASSLAFIDQDRINAGFLWLAKQVNETTGAVDEQDWRLAKDSLQYRIMLSAEVLIAILECNKSEEVYLLNLQGAIFSFLEENIKEIVEPMVLAKVTYAFMLSDNSVDEFTTAKKRLESMKRKDKQENLYWSNVEETNESKLPFWYHKGAQASAIEATAYALIIFLHDVSTDAEAIADWLVGQRNPNGAFIGAMGSTIAIQALAKYSFQKHGMKVDLCCNVSSDIQKSYFHSFKFTGENATHEKSLNNVPVGQVLDVQTKGQGLGQMQVNVEYNIPIDKNQMCPFKMVINVSTTNSKVGVESSNPLCTSCNIGCPKHQRKAVRMKVRVNKSVIKEICKGKQPPYQEGSICKKLKVQRKRSSVKKGKPKEVLKNKRQSRSAYGNDAISKPSICINICLQHRKKFLSDPTAVHIEMLTGYKPIAYDIDMIKKLPHVQHVAYDNTTETLTVQFSQITYRKKTCWTFRAVVEQEVDRLLPAVVEVKKLGTVAPLCVSEYHPPEQKETLQTYCAKNIGGNQRECKCFPGHCAKSHSNADEIGLHELKKMVCATSIAYQLQYDNNSTRTCDEIDAEVISVKKSGNHWNHGVTVGSLVKLSKSGFCACPKPLKNTERIILLSTVETFVDKQGYAVNRHMVDEQSTLLWFSTMPSSFLEHAFTACHG